MSYRVKTKAQIALMTCEELRAEIKTLNAAYDGNDANRIPLYLNLAIELQNKEKSEAKAEAEAKTNGRAKSVSDFHGMLGEAHRLSTDSRVQEILSAARKLGKELLPA